jgi:hypothetical protein
MKKSIIIVIAVVLFVGVIFLRHRSSPPTDAQLSHDIGGVWQDGPFSINFNAKGGFFSRGKDSTGGTSEYGGTWVVSDGFLTMTLTNASGSHPDGRVGDIVRLRVVSADEHHISVLDGGHTNLFSR